MRFSGLDPHAQLDRRPALKKRKFRDRRKSELHYHCNHCNRSWVSRSFILFTDEAKAAVRQCFDCNSDVFPKKVYGKAPVVSKHFDGNLNDDTSTEDIYVNTCGV